VHLRAAAAHPEREPLDLRAPQPATLVSTFCVAATGNSLLDGPAGLAGPAAISLPGQVRSQL
jgi:hypothetical protein